MLVLILLRSWQDEATSAAAGLSPAVRVERDISLAVNLYGLRDNFDPEYSHVIPVIIKKLVDARHEGAGKIVAWGTGEASREFLYVEDAAEGIVLATERYNKPEPVNLGSDEEIKVKDMVYMIKDLTRFEGEVEWDTSKPNGQPRRKLDTSKAEAEFGFNATTTLREGLGRTVDWYVDSGGTGCK